MRDEQTGNIQDKTFQRCGGMKFALEKPHKSVITGLLVLAALSVCLFAKAELIPEEEISNGLKAYAKYKNLIGDIHTHSNFTDGNESPDFTLRYARDVSKLDFTCLTDHAELLAKCDDATIAYYRNLPQKYDEPGKFCVLFGYEWTAWMNNHTHRCVYSLDSNLPIIGSLEPGATEIEGLWEKLSGYDFITIPHVTVRGTVEFWKSYNPKIEPIVEFYNKWGNSFGLEYTRPVPEQNLEYTVINALKNGKRYGLMCSSDTHFSRPGSRLQEIRDGALEYSQSGFVGVWAESHTREAIFDALKNRRCYGMTGTRVRMMFAVNNSVMGSEIESSSVPNIFYKVSTEEYTFTTVSVLKITNGAVETIYSNLANASEAKGSCIDEQFKADSAYFLKADLSNSDTAISSPVWVNKKVN